MGSIHGIAVIGAGIFMLWIPWALLVMFVESFRVSLVVSIAAYFVIAYPLVLKIGDMANEAFKGADDD